MADGCVSIHGVGSAEFFERAEEVEDFKVGYHLAYPDSPIKQWCLQVNILEPGVWSVMGLSRRCFAYTATPSSGSLLRG